MKTYNSYSEFFEFLRGHEDLLKDSPPLRDFFNDCQIIFHSTCCAGKKNKRVTSARNLYSGLTLKLDSDTKNKILERLKEETVTLNLDKEEVGRIE
jgi:hypothetical protein